MFIKMYDFLSLILLIFPLSAGLAIKLLIRDFKSHHDAIQFPERFVRFAGKCLESNSKHKLHQCLIIYDLLQGSGTSRLKMSDHEDLTKAMGHWNSSESYQLNPASVIVSVVFSLIFLLGTIGNSLVLAVLLRSGQVGYNTTNLFILNLSVADFFFIIFCVPFQATIYSLEGWVFGSFMCKVVHFFINLTMYASSFTLAAVSVDRWVFCFSVIGFFFYIFFLIKKYQNIFHTLTGLFNLVNMWSNSVYAYSTGQLSLFLQLIKFPSQCHFRQISNDVLCLMAFCDGNDDGGNYIFKHFRKKTANFFFIDNILCVLIHTKI